MIFSSQREPYLKRLPTLVFTAWGIQTYDLDNLYPQRADEVRKRSFTLKAAVDRTAEFIEGEGFEDPKLAELVLNSEGQTANDVLDFIAKDKACFGFALHFKYNPFTYKIMEVTPLKFMYCRLGLPDFEGNVSEIKYSRNWEQDPNKELHYHFRIDTYPIFDPSPETVRREIEHYGIEDYPGQILYWTPEMGVYPSATFDAVFDNAQTQSEVGVYQLATIQNDFGIEKIFKYPGKFDTTEEKTKFKEELNENKGAKGAKSTLVVEAPDGLSENALIESIQMQNTDKMYEFTSQDVRNAIRESMSVPAAILGQLPEAGMFNQQDITESYNYFNAITRGHRNQISRVFKKIFKYWKDQVQISTFDIIPQEYKTVDSSNLTDSLKGADGILQIQASVKSGVTPYEAAISILKEIFGFTEETSRAVMGPAPVVTPVTPEQTPGAPALPKAVRPEVNDVLTRLSGTQRINFDRILRKFDNEQLTYERAFQDLKAFSLTDEEIKSYLGEK